MFLQYIILISIELTGKKNPCANWQSDGLSSKKQLKKKEKTKTKTDLKHQDSNKETNYIFLSQINKMILFSKLQ